MDIDLDQATEDKINNSYEVPNNVLRAKPRPIVSVRTSTYQHGKYIEQCIKGVLSQKTNFDFEFIIGEDFSTDGTREIVMKYAKEYPDIIRVITADENVGMRANGFRCIRAMRGKYIAICEGDDYWTDENKLQKQVDFLESNLDYSFCFHKVKVIYEGKEKKSFIFPGVKDPKWYTVDELLKTNYIPTNSVLYRRIKYDNYPTNVSPGDWYMHLYHANYGKIKFIDEVMSVYRKHQGGIWWDYDIDQNKIWRKYGIDHIALQSELIKLYGDNPKRQKIIQDNIDRLVDRLIIIDKKYKENLLGKVIERFPEQAERFIIQKSNKIEELNKELEYKHKEVSETLKVVDDLWVSIRKQDEIIKTNADKISQIQSMRVVRIYNKIAKFLRLQQF